MPTNPPQRINPDWSAGPSALRIAAESSGLWVPSADGGDVTIGMLDYTVTASVQQQQPQVPADGEMPDAGSETLVTPTSGSWGHIRVTCYGDLCRLEEPVLRLNISAIFHAWHHSNTLHQWNFVSDLVKFPT